MSLAEQLALALDPSRILRAQTLLPDPWQEELLLSRRRHILLNCSPQASARLYPYPAAGPGQPPTENPRNEHNHALGALRYLISRIDAHAFYRFRKTPTEPPPEPTKPLDLRGEHLWSPIH
jgi:hypothetical protein